ncbi:glycosyltransferase family 2 protein [Clostridium perfringens]|uniref:glycosyltransferase family A protein n=1 Tax=Clostridium perfringens TaxID=1502 RepID=UPI001ABA0830|nr:glycosyltransferase family A protein [Clostridium perfringens]MBO3395353.1 glycosyltransferase family 2 protein [Clostridium perfringens]MBO3401849.1 glycosyltransferase family 2 protein [Clostridium perfringens]MDM0963119.1 glycosyltransferase family A protein [Clostridium perfringens]MDU7110931.1 glycosyltransferase family A protein [Clostridium perfringens]
MNLEVLVSTMKKKDLLELVKSMKIIGNCTLVNQCDINEQEEFILNNKNLKFIYSSERGLSKSRNLAIKNAQCDICLLADDDLKYVDNYENIILNAFKKNPEYDIITFQVEGIDQKFKDYSKKSKKLGYINSLKVASVEIAFKLESIRKNNVQFNELIGAGSKYYMGEENVFLYDALRKGMKIKYLPIKIADIYVGDSTWFNGFNREYFYSKGAAFTAMNRKYSIFLIIQFLIRRRNLFKNDISIKVAFIEMIRGRRNYINEFN